MIKISAEEADKLLNGNYDEDWLKSPTGEYYLYNDSIFDDNNTVSNFIKKNYPKFWTRFARWYIGDSVHKPLIENDYWFLIYVFGYDYITQVADFKHVTTTGQNKKQEYPGYYIDNNCNSFWDETKEEYVWCDPSSENSPISNPIPIGKTVKFEENNNILEGTIITYVITKDGFEYYIKGEEDYFINPSKIQKDQTLKRVK